MFFTKFLYKIFENLMFIQIYNNQLLSKLEINFNKF